MEEEDGIAHAGQHVSTLNGYRTWLLLSTPVWPRAWALAPHVPAAVSGRTRHAGSQLVALAWGLA